jgi:hypothetical protein
MKRLLVVLLLASCGNEEPDTRPVIVQEQDEYFIEPNLQRIVDELDYQGVKLVTNLRIVSPKKGNLGQCLAYGDKPFLITLSEDALVKDIVAKTVLLHEIGHCTYHITEHVQPKYDEEGCQTELMVSHMTLDTYCLTKTYESKLRSLGGTFYDKRARRQSPHF